jgi:hypothetical protein
VAGSVQVDAAGEREISVAGVDSSVQLRATTASRQFSFMLPPGTYKVCIPVLPPRPACARAH